MRLYELARIIRSKNAGPFTLTVDVMFGGRADFDRALAAPGLCPARIALLYGVREADVSVRPFARVLTVKVSLPRPEGGSGGPGDTDVYGCQQHFPLGDIEV